MTTSRAVEAKKHAYRQTQDGIVISFVLHPNDVTSALATAPLGTRYACAFVEIGDDELPVDREEVVPDTKRERHALPAQDKNRAGDGKRSWHELSPAQQAGIRCSEASFQAFLREEGDATCDNADRAATYVRFVCGVDSRSDLNAAGSVARLKWRDMEAKFQAWLTVPA